MKRATIAILLLALLTGCSKTLTRGKAKDLISEHYHYDQAVTVQIYPTADEFVEGRKRGIWEISGTGTIRAILTYPLREAVFYIQSSVRLYDHHRDHTPGG